MSDIEEIIDKACKEYASSSLLIKRLDQDSDDKFTTGDAHLDEILGGGIRLGMVWEISGER